MIASFISDLRNQRQYLSANFIKHRTFQCASDIDNSSSSGDDENTGIATRMSKRNGNNNKNGSNGSGSNMKKLPKANKPRDLPPKDENLINWDRWSKEANVNAGNRKKGGEGEKNN